MRGVPRLPRGGGGGQVIMLVCLAVAQLVLVLVWLLRLAWFYTGGRYLSRRRLAKLQAEQLATQRASLYVVPQHHTYYDQWSGL